MFTFKVERAVKLLSEAALHHETPERIHQWALNAQENYEKVPHGSRKSLYLELAENQD